MTIRRRSKTWCCKLTYASALLLVLALEFPGPAAAQAGGSSAGVCSEEWYSRVEAQVDTGDGRGHGPDPGSTEWRSTVEFRLGIRDDPRGPPLETEAWCRHINEHYIEAD